MQNDARTTGLKACPFCGGEAERYTSAVGKGFENRQVQCGSCGASAFDVKWQRRLDAPQRTDDGVIAQELTAVVAGQQRLLRAVLDAIDTGRSEPLFIVRDQLRNFLADHGIREVPALETQGAHEGVIEAEDVKRDIRISIWNGLSKSGVRQDFAHIFIRAIMEEICMKRALAALSSGKTVSAGEGEGHG